ILRIERQYALQPLQQIQHYHRNYAEQQHRTRVLGPRHLVAFVHSRRLINQFFERAQNRIQKGAFTVEDVCHKNSQRLRRGQNQGKKEQDLQPTVQRHLKTSPGAEARKRDRSAATPPALVL